MKSKGFTLIELMIVIAIVGILVAVVMPNYRTYILESQRSDTQGKLLQIIELQERFYIDNFTYTTNLGGDPAVPGDGLDYPLANLTDPIIISYSGAPAFSIAAAPCLEHAVLYPDITNPTTDHLNRCFRLIATPLGDQVFDGGMIIDNRGRKVLEYKGFQPRDWNDNILPLAACPECGAFPPPL